VRDVKTLLAVVKRRSNRCIIACDPPNRRSGSITPHALLPTPLFKKLRSSTTLSPLSCPRTARLALAEASTNKLLLLQTQYFHTFDCPSWRPPALPCCSAACYTSSRSEFSFLPPPLASNDTFIPESSPSSSAFSLTFNSFLISTSPLSFHQLSFITPKSPPLTHSIVS